MAVLTALTAFPPRPPAGLAGPPGLAALKTAAARFREAVLSGDYRLAFELTSSEYQRTHTIGDLRWDFRKMTEQPGLLGLKPWEDDSFYEPPPEEDSDLAGRAYLVVKKTLDDGGGGIYEEFEAFAISLKTENGRLVVDEIRFGRQD